MLCEPGSGLPLNWGRLQLLYMLFYGFLTMLLGLLYIRKKYLKQKFTFIHYICTTKVYKKNGHISGKKKNIPIALSKNCTSIHYKPILFYTMPGVPNKWPAEPSDVAQLLLWNEIKKNRVLLLR